MFTLRRLFTLATVMSMLMVTLLSVVQPHEVSAATNSMAFIFLPGFNTASTSTDPTQIPSQFNSIKSALNQKYPGSIFLAYSYAGYGKPYNLIDTLQSFDTDVTNLNQYLFNSALVGRNIYLVGHSLGGAIAAYYDAAYYFDTLYQSAYHARLAGVIALDSPLNGVDPNAPGATCYRTQLNDFIALGGRQDIPILDDLTPGHFVVNGIQTAGNNAPVLSIGSTDDCFIPTTNPPTLIGDTYIASGQNSAVQSGGTGDASHGAVQNDPNAISIMTSWIDTHGGNGSSNTGSTSTPSPASPTPTQTQTTCSASGDGVTLFIDPNYGGSGCHTFGVGDYSDLSQFGLDQNVSSLQDTNASYHITFYDQTGLTGTPAYYDSNTTQLTGYWDNRARSMRVERHTGDGVTLCTDPGNAGTCHTFGVGEYSDLSQFGLDQNVSSLRDTNNAYHITLYDQKGLTGTPGYYDADISQLTGYWDNRARSMRVESHATDGVTLYVDGNYGGNTHTFGVGEYSDLSQFGLDQNVSSLRDANAGYHITFYDQKGLTGTPGYYDADTPQLTGYWDNRARSMRVEKHRPTSCNPGTDGIIAYIDANYQAGCLFITGDIPDLTAFNFEHVISSIRFAGSYSNNEQLAIYRQANYQDLCGIYTQDQPDLLPCTDQAVSVQVLPFTPPVSLTPSPTPSPTSASCPSPWNCADIDNPNLAGSQSLNSDTWTVQGAGGDIWDTADQFHYIWQTFPGDGSLSAQVLSQENTDGWAKAGVMFRQTSDPGSAYYAVELTPGNGVVVQYRTDQGVNAQMNAQISGSAPIYLKAISTGNNFTAATSTDGTTWNPVAGSSVTLNMSGTILAGLAVASHSSSLGTVIFNSVSITPATPQTTGCPSSWSCSDIDNPNLAGSQSLDNGTWTVQGAGDDIWNAADQFHYVWQTLPGDGSMSAQVLSQDNTDGWAKAGVMFRQTSDPDSAYYAVELTPGNGIIVQYRTNQGANAQMSAQLSGSAPVYLKAVRTGNVFTAAASTDGITWTPIAGSSVTLNVSGAILAGLAVASHSSALGTVTFNSVNLVPAAPLTTNCPAPWTCGDIGNPDLAGNQSLDNDTWTVQGAGNDIWDATDQFRYVWQSLPGDGSLSAQILSQTNTSDWAKAGVMFRQDTSTDSAFYLVALTPSNGLTVQYRTDQGVNAQMNVQISGATPMYVQAVRTGNSFSAFLSSDGVTWIPIDNSTVTLNVNGSMLAGLEVGSVNGGALSTATFNAVTLTAGSTPTPTETPTPTPTPAQTPTPTATPSSSVEILPSPWHLVGNNGASELYQSCDPGILAGKTTMRITYNLHGLQALGGDASAIIIDQNGWHYISLSDYGQNGLDGSQTVDIPLSAFPGLDLTQPIDGTIHTRFWYGSQFTVDITSIVIF